MKQSIIYPMSALLVIALTSLTFIPRNVNTLQVYSGKYMDVSGFDHMEVEVQNDFTCSREGITWSLFGELPVSKVNWNLDTQAKGKIEYIVDDYKMQGSVVVDLSSNEIKLKLQIREYGLIHWLLAIEDVDLEVG
ncbi:MAG: hypothetical protein RIF46_11695 [Cyclobacteriaceae bacterium]